MQPFNHKYKPKTYPGNVRVTFTRDDAGQPELLSHYDYYPYGMPMPGRQLNPANHRYGYQGEFAEKDRETGFNHFELRDYDSRIGRWFAPDPYHQFISPYIGMGNNPIFHIDPSGGRCTWSHYSTLSALFEVMKQISRNRNAMHEFWMQNHTSGGQSMNMASGGGGGFYNGTCTTSEGDVIWVEGFVQAPEYTAIKGENYRSQGGQLYYKQDFAHIQQAQYEDGTPIEDPKLLGFSQEWVAMEDGFNGVSWEWEAMGGEFNTKKNSVNNSRSINSPDLNSLVGLGLMFNGGTAELLKESERAFLNKNFHKVTFDNKTAYWIKKESLKAFKKLPKTKLGNLGRTLGHIGRAGTFLILAEEGYSVYKGEGEVGRFSYHLGTAGTTIAATYFINGLAGLTVGGTLTTLEVGYNYSMKFMKELSKGLGSISYDIKKNYTHPSKYFGL